MEDNFVKDKTLTYLFWDIGTNDNNSNYWYAPNTQIETTSEGTTVTETVNGASHIVSTKVKSSANWNDRRKFDVNFTIEFDIDNVQNTKFAIYDIGTTPNWLLYNGHYKIIVTATEVDCFRNGARISGFPKTVEATQGSVGFIDAGSNVTMSFRYKNFVVYEIQ